MKLSLQLRLLTETNKLHTTKKAWHKLQQRGCQKDCRAEGHQQRTQKRPPQFDQVDFEQIAEKRQAASQAKNDTNLSKQSGVSKNTQHNTK